MKEQQKQGTPMRPLAEYVGRYYNRIGTFFIDISSNGSDLVMTFQGFEQVSLDLAHYEEDIFARPNVHRDADMKACTFPSWKPAKQKVAFLSSEAGFIDGLSWHHESYLSTEATAVTPAMEHPFPMDLQYCSVEDDQFITNWQTDSGTSWLPIGCLYVFVDIPQDAEDQRRNNLVFESHDVTLRDTRPTKDTFDLDQNGFPYRDVNESVPFFSDFSDRPEVEGHYLPMMEDYLRRHLEGVDRVFFF
ncbi:Fc.00g043000.m01.CDS01 [Cosmosporella sp. VM-42]